MASKAIKGLTVEIGGDTTKLGKALKDVESKGSSLSKELGDINRLLKFDPKNTDLLAQKQKVLAEAIDNTEDKLKTLKEAEKQVQKQFKRGEVSEEQVRALQREIVATEGKLKKYKTEAKDASKKTKDYGEEAKKADKNTSSLGKTLANVAKTGFKAIGAAAGAAITGLTAAAESTREYRTNMGKLNTAFTQQGFSAEAATGAYTEMVGVLGESDQAVEAANHLAMLTDNEKDLATWTGDILPGVFATFGDSLPIEGLTEAANETAKVGQVTGPLADALNWAGISEEEFNKQLAKCSSEQERQALIMNTLSGAYGDASEAYKEANAEVIRANQANEAWMASLAGVGAAFEPVITDVKMMGAELLSELVPGVEKLAEAFRGLLSGDVSAASDLGAALSGIITQVLDKITQLLPTVAQAGMALLTTLTTTIISMLPDLLTTGVEIIMAILDGLTSAIPQVVDALVNMIPRLVQALVKGIPQLIQGAVQLLLAIVDAIPQIIPPLVEALPEITMAIINGLLTAIPQLIQGAVQFLMAIVQAIPQIVSALLPELGNIVTTICDGLGTYIPMLLEGALQLFQAILAAIPLLLEMLLPQLGTIIDTIITCFLDNLPVLLDAAVQLFMALVQAIPQIVTALVDNLPQILAAIKSGLAALPRVIWGVLQQTFPKFTSWLSSLWTKVKTGMATLVTNAWSTLKQLPGKIWSAIVGAVQKVGEWGSNMVTRVKLAATTFLNTAWTTIKQLPGKIWNGIIGAVQKVVQWGTNLVTKGKEAASKLVTAIVTGVTSLPGKLLTVGKNLVSGLWSGISNSYTWIKDKIKGWVGNVLSFIKKLFGIHSPSTETAWMGEMLDEGLAGGLLDNVKAPIKAMDKVAAGVLGSAEQMSTQLAAPVVNGPALERSLQQQSYQRATASAAAADNGLMAKLDGILAAIKAGQILAIDGDLLVGGTVARFDRELGQRQLLAARGAI